MVVVGAATSSKANAWAIVPVVTQLVVLVRVQLVVLDDVHAKFSDPKAWILPKESADSSYEML
jgi:hypothetical protein